MIDWDGPLRRHGQDDWKMARPYAEETCTVIMLSPSKRNMTRNMGRTFLAIGHGGCGDPHFSFESQ